MKTRKNILLIINPVAGQGKGKKYAFGIVNLLSAHGNLVTLHPTSPKTEENIKFIIDNVENYDALVCCGGDGTLSETLSGIVESKTEVPLGYIPLGTTNDFAKTLGISTSPIEAAMSIAKWKSKKIDCGLFNRKVFSYVAATGAFTEASYSTTSFEKNFWGHFAYILRGIESLGHLESFHMKVKADDKLFEGDYIYASVSNTTSLGGVFKLDPQKVKTDDGLFELVLIRCPKTLADLRKLIYGIVSEGLNSNYVEIVSAKNIKIKSDTNLGFSLDGENGGKHNKIVIKNLQQRINLLGIQ